MSERIRRAVYPKKGGPGSIRIVEGEIGPLAPNHIRIDVHYAGINFADLMMRIGIYGAAPPFPFTPGYEVSGTITEIGKDVRNRSVGDRVVAMTRYGGYATMVDVHPNQSLKMAKAIIDYGGNPKVTIYENVGHNSWDIAFKEKDFLKWMHSKNKKQL